MASKAHGKAILYVSPEIKGSLIEVINHRMPDADKAAFMLETGKRFVTYAQAIKWLVDHQA